MTAGTTALPARRPTRRSAQRPTSRTPTLRHERRLMREGDHIAIAGIDEVGRGALAGPVSVGVVVVDLTVRTAPAGLRDSKLLTPAAREDLAPKVARWALDHAVGHAEPAEIDAIGILRALRLAGTRALARLRTPPPVALLDGNYDWLTRPEEPAGLFDLGQDESADPTLPVVHTLIKGDLRCAAVAGASVLAKTQRDAIMVDRAPDFPEYGWSGNKGYASPDHIDALRRLGPSEQHRRSWRLPGCEWDMMSGSPGPGGPGSIDRVDRLDSDDESEEVQ